jgi:hypothetical protein
MPTTATRTQVTHTPAVQRAIDEGARHWPEIADKPATILARLATLGADRLVNADEEPPLLMVPAAGRRISLGAIEEELAYGL